MDGLHNETKKARNIKIVGLFGWVMTTVLAFSVQRSDLLGAAGAVGLVALLLYIFEERQAISNEKLSMQRFYGQGFHDLNRMTSAEYATLSEDEKHEADETGSDIGTFEMMYENDLQRVENTEIKLAAFLTLQWAFGSVFFDSLSWIFIAIAETRGQ